MLPPLPRCSDCVRIWSIPQSYQSSPIQLSGRPAHRPFRGLFSVHSRCGLHTRAATVYRGNCYPKASSISLPPYLLRLLLAGAVARWDSHPQESAAFARRTLEADFYGVPKRTFNTGLTPVFSRKPNAQREVGRQERLVGCRFIELAWVSAAIG